MAEPPEMGEPFLAPPPGRTASTTDPGPVATLVIERSLAMSVAVASRRLLLALLLLTYPAAIPSPASADEPDAKKVIAATEAHHHVGETGTFEMTVRSSKDAAPRREYYLDSEEDFHDEKNLALVISYDHAELFQQAGVDDPAEHYKGKSLRVTGKVIRENDQVRIRVEDPKQIKLVGGDGSK